VRLEALFEAAVYTPFCACPSSVFNTTSSKCRLAVIAKKRSSTLSRTQ